MLGRGELHRHLSDIAKHTRSVHAARDIVKSGTSFWLQHKIEDLENTTPDLELARRHNLSLPFVKDQTVVGKIVRVDRDHVTVHTGHRVPTAFAKKELNMNMLVKSTDIGMRQGPRDFRVGDVMHFVLEELQTPFGDIGLRVAKAEEEQRFALIWAELEQCQRMDRTVKGRILNPINRGYSVGIAGLIAFLPLTQCSVITSSKVGVLQDFYVHILNREKRNIVVADKMVRQERVEKMQKAKERNAAQLKSLEPRLAIAEQQIAQQMAADSKQPEILRGRMTGLQCSALIDYCSLYILREKEKHYRPGMVNPVPLHRIIRIFGSHPTRSTIKLRRDLQQTLVRELKQSADPDLFRLLIARMKAWNLRTETDS